MNDSHECRAGDSQPPTVRVFRISRRQFDALSSGDDLRDQSCGLSQGEIALVQAVLAGEDCATAWAAMGGGGQAPDEIVLDVEDEPAAADADGETSRTARQTPARDTAEIPRPDRPRHGAHRQPTVVGALLLGVVSSAAGLALAMEWPSVGMGRPSSPSRVEAAGKHLGPPTAATTHRPTAAARADLRFELDPPHATVTVDGVQVDAAQVIPLEPGVGYRVAVTAPGFQPMERVVVAAANVTFRAALQPDTVPLSSEGRSLTASEHNPTLPSIDELVPDDPADKTASPLSPLSTVEDVFEEPGARSRGPTYLVLYKHQKWTAAVIEARHQARGVKRARSETLLAHIQQIKAVGRRWSEANRQDDPARAMDLLAKARAHDRRLPDAPLQPALNRAIAEKARLAALNWIGWLRYPKARQLLDKAARLGVTSAELRRIDRALDRIAEEKLHKAQELAASNPAEANKLRQQARAIVAPGHRLNHRKARPSAGAAEK